MDKIARRLASMASVMHLVAYALYNSAVLSGVTRPNLVPWAIWGALAVLNAVTYRQQTGDKVKAMLSQAGAVAAVITFMVAASMGGVFQNITYTNSFLLASAFVAVVIWKVGSAKYANFCVIAAVAVGFVPFFKDPSGERVLPWLCWSIATCIGVAVVYLRPKDRKNSDFIMPVSLAALHTGVLIRILCTFGG
ncbi:hypothetical protein KW807_02515 [Candidatus Parcubacteria bacterium]|nr:hypothetical protein [Candidatus Parcubacteria bacterium]